MNILKTKWKKFGKKRKMLGKMCNLLYKSFDNDIIHGCGCGSRKFIKKNKILFFGLKKIIDAKDVFVWIELMMFSEKKCKYCVW